jgi:hypothetical protein
MVVFRTGKSAATADVPRIDAVIITVLADELIRGLLVRSSHVAQKRELVTQSAADAMKSLHPAIDTPVIQRSNLNRHDPGRPASAVLTSLLSVTMQ